MYNTLPPNCEHFVKCTYFKCTGSMGSRVCYRKGRLNIHNAPMCPREKQGYYGPYRSQ